MDHVLDRLPGPLLWLIAGALVLFPLVTAAGAYLDDRAQRGKGRSAWLFLSGALLAGIAGLSLFFFIGTRVVCGLLFPSEMCGLFVILIGPPAGLAAGMWSFVLLWKQYGRRNLE